MCVCVCVCVCVCALHDMQDLGEHASVCVCVWGGVVCIGEGCFGMR